MRLTHGVNDKFIKDLGSVIELSKGNDNTVGCKIEADLETMSANLTKWDKEIMDFEKKCLMGAKFGSKEVADVAKTTRAIDDDIKVGRKKVAALKSLFKL